VTLFPLLQDPIERALADGLGDDWKSTVKPRPPWLDMYDLLMAVFSSWTSTFSKLMPKSCHALIKESASALKRRRNHQPLSTGDAYVPI